MNTAVIHNDISHTLQRVAESVLLSDWRTLSKEHLLQDVARLRSIKAQYMTTHFAHRWEIHQEMLRPLDQALLALYLVLDTLEGRDLAKQLAMYHALLEAQTPLLLTWSVVSSVGEVQTHEGNALRSIAEQSEHTQPDAVGPHLLDTPRKPSPERAATMPSEEEGSGSSTWFRWTQERERQLMETITQSFGSLDCVDMTAIKQIAAQHDWPWRSVDYKVRRLKAKQSPRETQQETADAATEDD